MVIFLLANVVRYLDIMNVYWVTVQADAPLAIRPMLPYLTRSEIHAVMTGGFATIAGSVLAAYIIFGVSFLSFALYLLASWWTFLRLPIVNSFPARSWLRLISCFSLLVKTYKTNFSPVLGSSKPYPWPQGQHDMSLALKLKSLVLALTSGVSIMSAPSGWYSTARHPSTAGSGKWLYYRSRYEMDALNCARRDAMRGRSKC